MAQDVMIRDSNISFYNNNARGPIATPLETRNNITRFNEAQKSVYGSPSIYGDQPGFNFGFRQPFVWVSPSDSDFDKYLKRFDSRAFPIGSVAQDVQRIGKLMISGKGVFFTATQLLLQSQQSFNETNLYNPLSVIQMTAQPATLGLTPRVTRHFNQDNFLASFGFSSGLDSSGDIPAPQGTAGKKALSNEAKPDGAKGLLRAKTANAASTKFKSKWGTNNSSSPGFFNQLLSSFAPGLLPVSKPDETYRADDKSFKTMVDDDNKAFLSSRLNSGFIPMPGSINPFTLKTTPENNLITLTKNSENKNSRILSDQYNAWKSLPHVDSKGTGPDHSTGLGNTLGNNISNSNPKNLKSNVDETLNVANPLTYSDIPERGTSDVNTKSAKNLAGTYEEIKYGANDVGYGSTNTDVSVKTLSDSLTNLLTDPNSNKNYSLYRTYVSVPNASVSSGGTPTNGYEKTIKRGSLSSLGLSSINSDNETRAKLDKVNSNNSGRISAPEADPNPSPDLIPFFFNDIVNNNIVQFHATLTGLGVTNDAEWDNLRYLGRADQIYIYRGFTRTLNFNFTFYAMNSSELDAVWTKVNYLSGLTQPSQYTNGFVIVPPFIKITIGNFFQNQPVILNSVGLNLKDEGGWVLDDGQQLPMFGDISCNCTLLEIYKPETKNPHYGFKPKRTQQDQTQFDDSVKNSKALQEKLDAFIANGGAGHNGDPGLNNTQFVEQGNILKAQVNAATPTDNSKLYK